VADKWVKIRLMPQKQELTAPYGSNLLKFLQSKNIPIGSACGGMGLCASCKVIVLSTGKGLSRPSDRELEIKDRNNLQKTERIACQCTVIDDVEITTSYW
jgi:2Fe-2S ferredoxin